MIGSAGNDGVSDDNYRFLVLTVTVLLVEIIRILTMVIVMWMVWAMVQLF